MKTKKKMTWGERIKGWFGFEPMPEEAKTFMLDVEYILESCKDVIKYAVEGTYLPTEVQKAFDKAVKERSVKKQEEVFREHLMCTLGGAAEMPKALLAALDEWEKTGKKPALLNNVVVTKETIPARREVLLAQATLAEQEDHDAQEVYESFKWLLKVVPVFKKYNYSLKELMEILTEGSNLVDDFFDDFKLDAKKLAEFVFTRMKHSL